MNARSLDAIAPRLQPLVGGLVVVIVGGRIVTMPHLNALWGTWTVAAGLTLAEARATLALLGPPEDVAGLQRLEARCLDQEPELCVQLAEERLQGRDAPYDPERAKVLVESACQAGSGEACKRAAELAGHEESREIWFERGCALNQGDCCVHTAARLLQRPGTPERIAQGRAILTRACDNGAGPACMALADERAKDYPGEAEPPIAEQKAWLRLVERACEGRDAEACYMRAKFSRKGLIVPRDPVETARWFRAACALDPSGGSIDVEVKFAGGDPAMQEEARKAGCTGKFPPQPRDRTLCVDYLRATSGTSSAGSPSDN